MKLGGYIVCSKIPNVDKYAWQRVLAIATASFVNDDVKVKSTSLAVFASIIRKKLLTVNVCGGQIPPSPPV